MENSSNQILGTIMTSTWILGTKGKEMNLKKG
jgi:hypothetical protein